MTWNIDFTLVAIYLVVVLVVGIVKGRNVKTVKQYAIADRNYTTAILVASLGATFMDGGSIMGLTEKVISYGLIFSLLHIGPTVALILIAKFIAPRMQAFGGMISAGDIMHKFYGKPGRVVTGLAATVLAIGQLGVQTSSVGYFFSFFMGIPHYIGILIASGAIIIYSAFGGIKAVTATDVIQFILIIVAIPTITNIALGSVGGYEGLFAIVPESRRVWIPEVGAMKYLFLGILFYMPFINPAVMQRLLMAKDTAQMKKSMYVAAIIQVPFHFYITIIALIAIALDPNVAPNAAVPFLLDTAIPTGFKGLMIVGILAIIMSTADSYLNVAGISLVHDVCNPLRKKPMPDKQELLFIRLASVAVGLLGILAAISFESVIDLILNFLGAWVPAIVVPLYAGIFGLKASSKSFLIGAISGVAMFILWKMFNLAASTYIHQLIPAMLANALGFFGSHYYFKNCSFCKKNAMPG